jgi:hypothetical protein
MNEGKPQTPFHFFIFTIPLAYWLAGAFSRAGVKEWRGKQPG